MEIQELANKCIQEIEEKSFCVLDTVFAKNINMQESEKFQLIYTVCQSGKYRLDLTPNIGRSDKSWVLLKDPNHALSEDVAQTNESVRKVNKWFIATIVISAVSLFASISGVIVQSRQLELQKQQLLQKPLPIKVEIDQPVQVSIPQKEDSGISPSKDTGSLGK